MQFTTNLINYTFSCIFPRSNAGIFIPETRRYYLTSHSGLWRICRFSLVPTVLANSTAARNFTTLALTNASHIIELKKTESFSPYILDTLTDIQLSDDPIEQQLDNDFRKMLFARWVRSDTNEFGQLKETYKRLVTVQEQQQQQHQQLTQHQISVAASKGHLILDPTNVAAINETIGAALSTIDFNGTYINVIVPEGLRNALFADWEEKTNVLLLLGAFAKDMDIPNSMTNSNGTRYIIQPPPPPKKGRIANGYEYKTFRKYLYIYGE